MIKYISCHDFHFDPSWSDISRQCGEAVARAAEEHGADFIITSDLFNRPLYASDKGGLNVLREIVRSWTRVCPVVAVQGTPSHDAQGCYGPLEDLGLVLLKPGMVYGYYRYDNMKLIFPIEPNPDEHRPSAILFGVPELSKQTIVNQLGLPADEANAEAVKLFDRYVTEFIAPRRAQFPDIPAVGVLHGTVSDSRQENSTDVVVRASDIVIRTETLALAGLDRWSLGHFHKPQEFFGCSAGYCGFTGIDDHPWGQTGFVPGMNLITIETILEKLDNGEINKIKKSELYDKNIDITRLPYGTPRREKITAPIDVYDPGVAYWLETDDASAAVPAGHPWSRITHTAARTETQRVTKEQADAVKGLPDLFRLIDPDVTERVLAKVATIAERVKREAPEAVEVIVENVEIKGCTLFKGETVHFDINALPPGLTAIIGDNGAGKSSLAAFCTPYPVIVGKDTLSGRQSAIKDFFSLPDSQITKRLRVNGVEHKHVINIKGAHTQNPRVECYLYVAGESLMETASWDEMLALTEALYGPYIDYLITSFYVQPQQSRSAPSGLMMATMTDIRDLVQTTAGIDREPEKRFALDRVKECRDEIERKTQWIAGAESSIEDMDTLKERSDALRADRLKIDERFHTVAEEVKQSEESLNELTSKKRANDAELQRKQTDEEDIVELSFSISAAEQAIEEGRNLTARIPKLTAQAEALTKRRDALAENRELKIAYDNEVMEYNRELDELKRSIQKKNDEAADAYRSALRDYEDAQSKLNFKIEKLKAEKERLDKPCPKCGYLDPEADNRICAINKELDGFISLLANIRRPGVLPIPDPLPRSLDRPLPIQPVYIDVPEVAGNLADVQSSIAAANSAAGRIESLEAQIKRDREKLDELSAKTYSIDATIDERHAKATEALQAERKALTEATAELSSINATINALDQQIAKQREMEKRIEEENAATVALQEDENDWNYIAGMLAAAKIPALELSLVTDSIDAEATRLIEPYDTGRFSFRTITQDVGKAGLVDRFDIRVHDGETGEEKSFLQHSPGQKAFLNDAYVKALILIRNNRMHRMYSPIISDEADGPLQPSRVPAYYDIQRNYYADTDTRVLVISHAPDGQNYIQNAVSVHDLKGGVK